MSSTTTVQGMKYSDQLAALLEHAIANGWRVEPNPREKPNGALCYSPDKSQNVIRLSEKGAKFNRAHYENIRREFYRAGLPPLPGDAGPIRVATADAAEDIDLEPGQSITDLREVFAALADPARGNSLVDMCADPATAPSVIGVLVEGLAGQFVNHTHASFAGSLTSTVLRHLHAYSEEAVSRAAAQVEQAMRKEVDDALAMAAEAERRADAEERASLRAAEREGKARQDCAAALRRAEEAEAKAARLEAAIAPLRGLLTTEV